MDTTTVVSGGGTGIGRAVALRLAADGGHVTIAGRRAEPLAETARAHPERITSVVADVSTPDGARAVLEAVGDRGVTGVVAAAGGLTHPESTETLEEIRDDWLAGFRSNVLSAVLFVEALRPSLQANAGRVVLLSSIAGLRGGRSGPYGAVKAALHAWMYDLARQLGPHGGTANVMAPGFVPDTGFWEGRLTPELIENRLDGTFVHRPGTPEEIASQIAWLLGPDGGWFTGQILSPNGGVVLGR